MIRKSDLIDAINDLSHDLTNLSIKVSDLQREIDDLKSHEATTCTKIAKRGRGRPCKDAQPRDKSGKFAKK